MYILLKSNILFNSKIFYCYIVIFIIYNYFIYFNITKMIIDKYKKLSVSNPFKRKIKLNKNQHTSNKIPTDNIDNKYNGKINKNTIKTINKKKKRKNKKNKSIKKNKITTRKINFTLKKNKVIRYYDQNYNEPPRTSKPSKRKEFKIEELPNISEDDLFN